MRYFIELAYNGKSYHGWQVQPDAITVQEKINKAIKLGLQRRPKRATSAENFLNYVIPEVKKAIQKKDKKLFNENFKMMRTNCTSCHMAERVPTFTVQIPTDRQSPIRKAVN